MNLGDDERKENIKTYFYRAKKKTNLKSDLDKQFYAEGLKDVWHSFDAFLGLNFPHQSNREMRKIFVKKYQPIFEDWKMSDMFRELVKRLVTFGKLHDMAPINPKSPIDIKDEKSLLEILDFSYRVRSNLNHGSKDLESDNDKAKRNRSLVEFSFKITFEILERTLIEEKVI